MKQKTNKTALIAAASVLAWCVGSWVIARAYYLFRAEDLIRQGTQVTDIRTRDLAESITKNLNYLSGASDLLAHQMPIRAALSRPDIANPNNSLPYEANVRRWANNPVLTEVSRDLAIAETDLNVEVAAVTNAEGDIIAASNWDKAISGIGLNISGRDYFRMNRIGRPGMQIAAAEATHVAGLFFSAPVIVDGGFRGSVVVKVNIPPLSFLTRQTDAFVVDRNGVILLAYDQEKEMHSMPGAQVGKMPAAERTAIYQRSDFPELHVSRWEDPDFDSLVNIQSEPAPHLMSSKELHGYGLTIYVKQELGDFIKLKSERQGMFWLLSLCGSLVILLATGISAHMRAISRAKKDVEYQANYDVLTRLPNRRLLMRLLDQELRETDRSRRHLAVLMIDLDGFKEVNDALGHIVGDTLLVDAANRIRNCLRESDTVARFGGDEFVIVLPEYGDPAAIERIARKILDGLAKPFILTQESAYISASIGIVLYPDDATDGESLLKHADQAMYAAKHAGRNRFHYYLPTMEEAAQTRRGLVKELRQALPLRQLQVYYQPIVELKSGALHKAEALIRWHHPVHGLVSPAEFIPVAEASGMIREIGDWVFRQAARQAMLWRDKYDPQFQISVNKSPAQFKDPVTREEDTWIAHIQRHGLSGDSICVEITEGLLLHAEDNVKERLLEFSQMGVQVSIDDFGTGYSSLAYLKKFDIDYLKIDKTFVCDLATSYDNLVLCEAIITLAHNLGLKVIAEGVETALQRDILARFGCDYAQGYLFSRPVPPEEFEKLFSGRQLRGKVSPLLRLVS